MQVITLISIWLSLLMSIITLAGAIIFWLQHSKLIVKVTPLKYYPRVTLVVPAHNEELVIGKTASAILNLYYPQDKLEVLFYADNCEDQTAAVVEKLLQKKEY